MGEGIILRTHPPLLIHTHRVEARCRLLVVGTRELGQVTANSVRFNRTRVLVCLRRVRDRGEDRRGGWRATKGPRRSTHAGPRSDRGRLGYVRIVMDN